jgi:hypothetical protein
MMNYTESNKMIAEFMGAKPRKPSSWGQYYEFYDNEGLIHREVRDDSMKYHTSWNWLMPVVAKIEELDTFPCVVISGYHTEISFMVNHNWPDDKDVVASCGHPEAKSRIDGTYKAVVQFIQWFNQHPHLLNK